MIMLISTIVVLLACLGFIVLGLLNLRTRLIAELSTLAQMVSSHSSAALTSGDAQEARAILKTLSAKPSIIAATMYTNDGKVFAEYRMAGTAAIPPLPKSNGFHADRNFYLFRQPIVRSQQRIGTLYIISDLRERNGRLRQYGAIATSVLIVSLLTAYVLAARLQRRISAPIIELARVAALVSREKTFTVRANHTEFHSDDEISNLVLGFNSMLGGLEQRDQEIALYQTKLETTVEQRTAELTAANQELLIAKDAAEKTAAINAQLARESALILNSATDGILGIDLQNRPTFLNPAGVQMIGRSLAEMQKTTVHAAIHHSYPDGTPWPEEECSNTVTVRQGEAVGLVEDTFWRSDGSSFPVEYSSTPMLDENGNNIGAVIVFRDVTERRAIDKLKSEFVSTVSHELRTPLTSIRGALGLLGSGLLGTVAEKGQRMLEIAVANTDRLVRLINDILDLERIESGRVELRRGLVDAQTVVDQAREGLQSMADDGKIRIVVEPFAGTLWGDSDRIIQTLTNLIGNAVKFSPANTTVTLSGTAGPSEFTFCVADEGRGVPDDQLTSIFQRFNQVDASDSRAKGGSGLGLAICQSIVTAHGGRIWAEKNDPAGTRVQFTIPLAKVETMNSAAAGAAAERDNPSVLVIEDDLDLARVMTASLQNLGLRTLHTASGCDALRLCRKEQPSMIVMDLGLPDVDGFAVVKSLRRLPVSRHVPLLVYSARDLGSADQTRLRLGPTRFLTKSRCSPADFQAHVIALLETAKASDAA